MSFNLDEYVDVAARIGMFSEKYPEGSLQGDGYFVRDPDNNIIGYHYVARAYRSPLDERPGVGTAYEPIPGKTPYTRDSEVQNSETSAWGRAIVALGFVAKKIASAEEVRARQEPDGAAQGPHTTPVPGAAPGSPAPSGAFVGPPPPDKPPAPADGGDPMLVEVTFGKHKGKTVGELLAADMNYLSWLGSDKYEPKNAETRRIKGAAVTVLQIQELRLADDDSIPF